MIVPASCNSIIGISLLDYAYLALNVYHDHNDDKLIGIRPFNLSHIYDLKTAIQSGKEGWARILQPQISIQSTKGFFADLYVKIYHKKIQHIMVAFRGTYVKKDYEEDAETWWETVLPGTKHKEKIPSYWEEAKLFLILSSKIISRLEKYNLLDENCGHHITGHSLGGALANLVAAKTFVCRPTELNNTTLPNIPNIISFNAPGIGDMPNLYNCEYAEGQVISMRAKYDMISALGTPYGYVINNIVKEGFKKAKKAFAIEQSKEHKNFKQLLCDRVINLCDTRQRFIQLSAAKALYEQHSMNNFLRTIANDQNHALLDFDRLKSWARSHGGKNHDESCAPMIAAA